MSRVAINSAVGSEKEFNFYVIVSALVAAKGINMGLVNKDTSAGNSYDMVKHFSLFGFGFG